MRARATRARTLLGGPDPKFFGLLATDPVLNSGRDH
jgi:hypothetical protein